MAETSIEWSDWVWNILRGCSEISPGCLHCYAAVQAWRFAGPGMPYEGLVKRLDNGKIVWTGKLREVPEKLSEPFHWRKPRKVFVNSMSDLFHEDVSDAFLDRAFAVMALAKDHTFQILTKRPARMAAYLTDLHRRYDDDKAWSPKRVVEALQGLHRQRNDTIHDCIADFGEAIRAGLPNHWLGVSVEDQTRAGERIGHLLRTPASVRYLSLEPLLAHVDISPYLCDFELGRGRGKGNLHWVIVGGESGYGARPCDVAWIRSIVRQCRKVRVPCFVKQLGSRPYDSEPDEGPEWPAPLVYGNGGFIEPQLRDKKGGDPDEWPEDLSVRQFPELRKAVA